MGIAEKGFEIPIGAARTGPVRHGFELKNFGGQAAPPPVHFLGYGVYFTTSKNIAKKFNQDTARGLTDYYIDAPRMETINFNSTNTMMKWWKQYGYEMQPVNTFKNIEAAEEARVQATMRLTANLKAKYDAVFFKGKVIGRNNLDGNQVCVFDPNNIYQIDYSNYAGEDSGNGLKIKVGDRILIKGTKTTAVIGSMQPITSRKAAAEKAWEELFGPYNFYLTLKSIKNLDDFKKTYEAPMKAAIQKTAGDLLAMRASHWTNPEENIAHLANHYLNIDNSFPSSAIERVFKKGERHVS